MKPAMNIWRLKLMKIVKIEKEDPRISRKMISQFGASIYNYPEVRSILIKVNFKDGSTLGFKRDEDDDEIKDLIERAKEC